MVHSVVAVPKARKVRRDQQNAFYSASGSQDSTGSFARILEDAKREAQSASMDCHTTTYGRDSMIRTFLYQPREYHF